MPFGATVIMWMWDYFREMEWGSLWLQYVLLISDLETNIDYFKTFVHSGANGPL